MRIKYDVAIIGSGPGGYVSAIRLSQFGKSVCVIDADDRRLGGVCLNEGCIPAKSLIYSAGIFSVIQKAETYGIEAEAKQPDIKKVAAASQNAATQLRAGLKSLFKKYGIEFIAGKAKIASKNEISIESRNGKKENIEAAKIIIAAGSHPKVPPGIDIDGKTIITSTEAIRPDSVPETLLVIGAGAVGTELAFVFASFGTKVTLIEAMPNILPFEDGEISKALTRIFKKRGMDVLTDTTAKGLSKKGNSVEAVLKTGTTEKKAEFERVLVAVGRRPNTEDIGLEEVGVKVKDGFIMTDARLRTNIENIYAVGDIINTPMYAHVAYKEGLVAAEDIAGVKTKPIDYESVPNVVFSEPQVASVGLTESKARRAKKDITISKHFFKANGMAVATHREEGFIKIIADKKTRAILGVHIIGSGATEILHEFVLAKGSNLTADDIANAVHAHPTFSEIAGEAARALF